MTLYHYSSVSDGEELSTSDVHSMSAAGAEAHAAAVDATLPFIIGPAARRRSVDGMVASDDTTSLESAVNVSLLDDCVAQGDTASHSDSTSSKMISAKGTPEEFSVEQRLCESYISISLSTTEAMRTYDSIGSSTFSSLLTNEPPSSSSTQAGVAMTTVQPRDKTHEETVGVSMVINAAMEWSYNNIGFGINALIKGNELGFGRQQSFRHITVSPAPAALESNPNGTTTLASQQPIAATNADASRPHNCSTDVTHLVGAAITSPTQSAASTSTTTRRRISGAAGEAGDADSMLLFSPSYATPRGWSKNVSIGLHNGKPPTLPQEQRAINKVTIVTTSSAPSDDTPRRLMSFSVGSYAFVGGTLSTPHGENTASNGSNVDNVSLLRRQLFERPILWSQPTSAAKLPTQTTTTATCDGEKSGVTEEQTFPGHDEYTFSGEYPLAETFRAYGVLAEGVTRETSQLPLFPSAVRIARLPAAWTTKRVTGKTESEAAVANSGNDTEKAVVHAQSAPDSPAAAPRRRRRLDEYKVGEHGSASLPSATAAPSPATLLAATSSATSVPSGVRSGSLSRMRNESFTRKANEERKERVRAFIMRRRAERLQAEQTRAAQRARHERNRKAEAADIALVDATDTVESKAQGQMTGGSTRRMHRRPRRTRHVSTPVLFDITNATMPLGAVRTTTRLTTPPSTSSPSMALSARRRRGSSASPTRGDVASSQDIVRSGRPHIRSVVVMMRTDERVDDDARRVQLTVVPSINANTPQRQPMSVAEAVTKERPVSAGLRGQTLQVCSTHEAQPHFFDIDECVVHDVAKEGPVYSLTVLELVRKFVAGINVALLLACTESAYATVTQTMSELLEHIMRRLPDGAQLYLSAALLRGDSTTDLLTNGRVGSRSGSASPVMTEYHTVALGGVLLAGVRQVRVGDVAEVRALSSSVRQKLTVLRATNQASRGVAVVLLMLVQSVGDDVLVSHLRCIDVGSDAHAYSAVMRREPNAPTRLFHGVLGGSFFTATLFVIDPRDRSIVHLLNTQYKLRTIDKKAPHVGSVRRFIELARKGLERHGAASRSSVGTATTGTSATVRRIKAQGVSGESEEEKSLEMSRITRLKEQLAEAERILADPTHFLPPSVTALTNAGLGSRRANEPYAPGKPLVASAVPLITAHYARPFLLDRRHDTASKRPSILFAPTPTKATATTITPPPLSSSSSPKSHPRHTATPPRTVAPAVTANDEANIGNGAERPGYTASRPSCRGRMAPHSPTGAKAVSQSGTSKSFSGAPPRQQPGAQESLPRIQSPTARPCSAAAVVATSEGVTHDSPLAKPPSRLPNIPGVAQPARVQLGAPPPPTVITVATDGDAVPSMPHASPTGTSAEAGDVTQAASSRSGGQSRQVSCREASTGAPHVGFTDINKNDDGDGVQGDNGHRQAGMTERHAAEITPRPSICSDHVADKPSTVPHHPDSPRVVNSPRVRTRDDVTTTTVAGHTVKIVETKVGGSAHGSTGLTTAQHTNSHPAHLPGSTTIGANGPLWPSASQLRFTTQGTLQSAMTNTTTTTVSGDSFTNSDTNVTLSGEGNIGDSKEGSRPRGTELASPTQTAVRTVVLLDPRCSETSNVTRDHNIVVATTEDDFEEYEVSEVVDLDADVAATDGARETRLVASSTVLQELCTVLLRGCNAALLCANSRSTSYVSQRVLCEVVRTVLDRLHAPNSAQYGEMNISVVRLHGETVVDLLQNGNGGGNAPQKLCIAISPIFGSCVHGVHTERVRDADGFDTLLAGALRGMTSEAAGRADHGLIFCSLILKLKLRAEQDVLVCSLTASFAGENAGLYNSVLNRSPLVPRALYHYALGGPCFTVALLAIDAEETRAHQMLQVQKRLGETRNRPTHPGSIVKFIKGIKSDLAPTLQRKYDRAQSAAEAAATQALLDRLAEMVRDAEALLHDFERHDPKAYLHEKDGGESATAPLTPPLATPPRERSTVDSSSLSPPMAPPPRANGERETPASTTTRVRALVCFEQRLMGGGSVAVEGKTVLLRTPDGGVRFDSDEVVTCDGAGAAGDRLNSVLVDELTTRFMAGHNVSLLAADSGNCAFTPLILRKIAYNVLQALSNGRCNSSTNSLESADAARRTSGGLDGELQVSMALIKDHHTADLLPVDPETAYNHFEISYSPLFGPRIAGVTAHLASARDDFDNYLAVAIDNADAALQTADPGMMVVTLVLRQRVVRPVQDVLVSWFMCVAAFDAVHHYTQVLNCVPSEPLDLFHYVLNAKTFTVAMVGVCDEDENPGILIDVLSKLSRVVNRTSSPNSIRGLVVELDDGIAKLRTHLAQISQTQEKEYISERIRVAEKLLHDAQNLLQYRMTQNKQQAFVPLGAQHMTQRV